MFYDTFLSLCMERGVKPTTVTTELGLSNATATHWKQRGTTPNGKTLQMIADYFGVSTDYLLTGSDPEEDPKQYVKDRIDRMSDDEFERFKQILKLTMPDKFPEDMT